MDQITDHMSNEVNDGIQIVRDESGAGGASHLYNLSWDTGTVAGRESIAIRFQNGPIGDRVRGQGPNGVTNEALLAVVLDRLRGFQSGEFKCRENALAITKIEEALHWLKHRTNDRIRRGVEGKNAA